MIIRTATIEDLDEIAAVEAECFPAAEAASKEEFADRLAPEVFMRITPTRRASEKHYRRLEEVAPKTGIVRVLRITEKQYESIYLLSGEIDYQEKTVGKNCHILL